MQGHQKNSTVLQLKQNRDNYHESTIMDLGISIFLIFVRCVALRNLE